MADLVARGEAELLIYQAEDGRTRIEVRFDGDTAWLSIVQMAELFQRDRSVILRHIGTSSKKASSTAGQLVQSLRKFNVDELHGVKPTSPARGCAHFQATHGSSRRGLT